MDFDTRTLGPVADSAGVPLDDVLDIVAAAVKDAYDASPNALPGVTVNVNVGSGRLELRDAAGAPVDVPGFGSRATTAARQAIVSWIRDRERLRKVGRWGQLEGTPIRATVKGAGRNGELRLDAQGAAAVMPSGEAVAGELLRPGQEVTVLLLAANVTDRDTVKLTVSRRQPALVTQLFTQLLNRTKAPAQVAGVAREPGVRSKVSCTGAGDPRAELIGPAGMVVRSVMNDLGGEKVDVVRYSEDLAEYAAAALTPAPVLRAEVTDAQRREVTVTVAPQDVALAEGAGGVNLRLAMRLTGARIVVRS